MKRTRDQLDSTEPLGIIISTGNREESEPRLSMYVWSAAPTEDKTASRAA